MSIFRAYFSDIFQDILANELKYEMQFFQYFQDIKKESLKKFDEVFTEKEWKRLIAKYADTNKSFNLYRNLFDTGIDYYKEDDPIINVISYIGADDLRKKLNGLFEDSAILGGQQVYREFEIPMNFAMDNQEVINVATAYNLKLSSDIANQLSNEIKFGIIQELKNGTSIPNIKKRILEIHNTGHLVKVPAKKAPNGDILRAAYSYHIPPDRYAEIIARSEAIRWTAEARVGAYEDTGVVPKCQLETAGDKRVCPICSNLEGTIYLIKDAYGVIPIHCMCRCTMLPIIDVDGSLKVPGSSISTAGDFLVTAVRIKNGIPDSVKAAALANIVEKLKLEPDDILENIDDISEL